MLREGEVGIQGDFKDLGLSAEWKRLVSEGDCRV